MSNERDAEVPARQTGGSNADNNNNTNKSSSGGGAAVVYAAVHDAERLPSRLTPIPAYELYKTAREEELCAYRGLCRVLAMHYVVAEPDEACPALAALPKVPRRLLEDVKEELCINEERAQLEWEAAMQDAVVRGVGRSGLLKRRAAFYDGVEEDVALDDTLAPTEDDGDAVHIDSRKIAKTEASGGAGRASGAANGASSNSNNNNNTNASTAAPGRPGRKPRSTTPALLGAITRIGREVEQAAQDYLYTTDTVLQERLAQTMQDKRQELVQLRQEIAEAAAATPSAATATTV